jgi:hypothetical protein
MHVTYTHITYTHIIHTHILHIHNIVAADTYMHAYIHGWPINLLHGEEDEGVGQLRITATNHIQDLQSAQMKCSTVKYSQTVSRHAGRVGMASHTHRYTNASNTGK